MGLSPISSEAPAPRWLSTAGEALAGPAEWQEALIALPWPPADLERTTASVNGQPLAVVVKRLGGRPQLLAEWPRSGPGAYQLAVSCGERVWRGTMTIRPAKLSQQDFQTLLGDLEHRLPALVALGIQRAGGLGGFTLGSAEKDTLVQEVERLQRAIGGSQRRPGLAQTLPRLAHRYRETLASRSHWRPRAQARRVSPAGLVASIRRPRNLDADGQPVAVLEPVAEPDADVYENRVVKLFVHLVGERMRRLQRALAHQPASPLAAPAADLERRLAAAVRAAGFLERVALPAAPPQRLTMALQRVPEYRAALEGLLELQRSLVVELDDPRLMSPLENLPALYQAWCTLHVVAHVLEIAADTGLRVQAQRLVRPRHGTAYVRALPAGTEALRLADDHTGATLRLLVEPTYGPSGPIRSISFPQRPDIVLEWRVPGQSPHLIVLDPKYKLDSGGDPADGSPVKADLDKMHAYRDAIRGPAGEPVVTYAAILYPGATSRYGTSLAALSATPDAITDTLASMGLEQVPAAPEVLAERSAEPEKGTPWVNA